jgi:hypothetical protein
MAPCGNGLCRLLDYLDIKCYIDGLVPKELLGEPFGKLYHSDIYFEDESDLYKEISLLTILESNGYRDFIWAFRTVKDYELSRKTLKRLAFLFAKLALPIFKEACPDDDSVEKAVEAAGKGEVRHSQILATKASIAADHAINDRVAASANASANAARMLYHGNNYPYFAIAAINNTVDALGIDKKDQDEFINNKLKEYLTEKSEELR